VPTEKDVLSALSRVQEPELHKDIVSLGMVRDLKVAGASVSFTYVLTTPACPLAGQMEKEAREAVLAVDGVKDVKITMSANVQKDVRIERSLPSGIKNIVAVGSGKGGVGKSTIACNLAVSLAKDGARVGLLDADVYGPNQPQMLGLEGWEPVVGSDNKMDPPSNFGVKLMSMGFLMEPDQPVIWRGPMLHGAITQFLKDVKWGELDYLVVDLPPGTGDVQLSLCQSVPLTGSVIVTTPQTIALSDVRKAVSMFRKLNVPILGVVENMSEFVCPHCEGKSQIFSHGGAQTLSDKFHVPVLGQIPLDPRVCEAGETGKPAVAKDPSSPTAQALRLMAKHVAAQISLANYRLQSLEIKTVA
jgi:ATP-binding protein involved in chromosome partitioning